MSDTNDLVCWKCGAPLGVMPTPWSRRAVCDACGAELHICRMCRLYNPRISDRCEEPRAEHPRLDDRANFCDWFEPRRSAFQPRGGAKRDAAKANLDALFGGEGDAPSGDARNALDELFGGKKK